MPIIRLGDMESTPPPPSKVNNPLYQAPEEEISPRKRTFILRSITAGIVAIAGSLIVFSAFSAASPFTEQEDTNDFGTAGAFNPEYESNGGVEPLPPTNFPTMQVTLAPTISPSAFPTTSAPQVADPVPTRSPTPYPTSSPVAACERPDAVCGCNLVVSQLVDVIFLVDESGSVRKENYLKMNGAIRSFVTNMDPAVAEDHGSHVAYIEFNHRAEKIHRLIDTQTPEAVVNSIRWARFNGRRTNHRAALEAAREFLEEKGPRKNAQTVIIMMTDGNPCVCASNPYGDCGGGCAGNVEGFNKAGINEYLREFSLAFNFTFMYLPIGNNINFDLFDDAGLGERLQRTGVASFDELDSVLNGGELTFPLGPCVEEPTTSSFTRVLHEETGTFHTSALDV